jgi:hypothetical protein
LLYDSPLATTDISDRLKIRLWWLIEILAFRLKIAWESLGTKLNKVFDFII